MLCLDEATAKNEHEEEKETWEVVSLLEWKKWKTHQIEENSNRFYQHTLTFVECFGVNIMLVWYILDSMQKNVENSPICHFWIAKAKIFLSLKLAPFLLISCDFIDKWKYYSFNFKIIHLLINFNWFINV